MGSSTEKANNGFSEEEQRISSQLEDLQRNQLVTMKCLEIPELKNYVDASSHIAAETFENTGEMGSSTEKANNGFSEEEQRISSQLEDLQRNQLVTMKCLKMPELEKTALVSSWDLTELSLIPRTKIIILQGEAGIGKSSIVTLFDLIHRRLWQNNISRLLRESEEDGLTEEKKRNLKTLVLFRNNRKNKVMLLEKPWIPLCSPVCYRGKQLSTLSYSTLGWDGQCSPLVSVHRTCSNSKRDYSFRSKNHTVYNKISTLISLLAYECNLPPPR